MSNNKYHTIYSTDDLGGMVYPFLPTNWQWQIVSRPLSEENALNHIMQAVSPTLRWVKDDKVLDLYVPGMNTADFLTRTGLNPSLHKGGYVLSKRLSRVMRPFYYAQFYAKEEVTIYYDELLNGRLWDGCGLVSRAFIQQMADSLILSAHNRRELLHSERFEVTTLHEDGQDKGHVLVVDDLAYDFVFPAHSTKTELWLQNGRIFIGLHPVHSEDQMCLDIQSLINLYPFFQPEQLWAWAKMESELFLDGIRNGRMNNILNRLYNIETAADLESLAGWHVGEYVASGGDVMWFAGMVKAVAKQHLNRLSSRTDRLRCPCPGGRYYLFPAAVGNRQVPEGHIELDAACATAWVNDQDWLTTIVKVLGGCDGDDAVWVFPFCDEDDCEKVLVWRSPNQVGEYVTLHPTPNSHRLQWDTIAGPLPTPKMKSRLLPPRIDSCNYQYGTLSEANGPDKSVPSYSPQALLSTIQRAIANAGVLGAHCNVLMMCKAVYGRLPKTLPATLEAVIDGSVKTGLDLSPVKEWNQMALQRMVKQGQNNPNRAIPAALFGRLPDWLQAQAKTADTHWLDTLTQVMVHHQIQYQAEADALAAEACPPLELFQQGRDWLAVGKEFRQVYAQVFRDSDDDPRTAESMERLDMARAISEAYLAQWPADKRACVLLGASAHLYSQGCQHGEPVRDGLLWQLGKKQAENGRSRGIAHLMIDALRQIGLLGEPVWTTVGAVLHYQNAPCARCAGVPITLSGVWFNWYKTTLRQPAELPKRMSDVSSAAREKAKTHIAALAEDKFVGMVLETAVTETHRVATYTSHGNLFGYVQKGQELLAARHNQWRIAWATAVDGNIRAILTPC